MLARQMGEGNADAAVQRALPRIAIYLAWVHWYSGEADRAQRVVAEAQMLAEATDNVHSSAFVLCYGGWVLALCGDRAEALQRAQRLLRLSSDHGLAYWAQLASFQQACADDTPGREGQRIATMSSAIDAMQASGGRVGVAYLLRLLAEVQLGAGRIDAARTTLDRAAELEAGGNRLYAAEVRRLQAACAVR
jgi:tetratricopeptide (TPR) repeat protein